MKFFQRSIYAREPADSLWPNQMLMVSEDFARLLSEEDESRPGLGLRVRLVQEHFLAAKEYLLNGQISWEADEPSDRGTIFLKDGVMEIAEDQIVNPGPSWASIHYASSAVTEAVYALLASADDTRAAHRISRSSPQSR